MEFLKRFSDKSAEVRIAAIDAAKVCLVRLEFFSQKEIAVSSGNIAHDILSKA
jgi:hypothetical protein